MYAISTFIALLAMTCVLAFSATTTAAAPLSEGQKIEFLLKALETSQVTVIRNGSAHSGADAAQHLRRKRERAGDRIGTAEDFIDHLASRSSASGEPYTVRLPDGTEVPSATWLRAQLRHAR